MSRSDHILGACVVFVVALVVRLGTLFLRPFDGLYGQDAFAYYDYARQLWDSTMQLQPPAPFYWPLGYPASIAGAFLFLGFTPLAGQMVSLLSGALVAPLIFLLTREISPLRLRASAPAPSKGAEARRGGGAMGAFLAGLIAAVSGQLLQMSVSVMSDAPAMMWSLLSALALVRYARVLRVRWLLLASLTLAFAILTRFVFATLLAPWVLACCVAWLRAEGDCVGRMRRAGAHLIAAILITLPFFVIQAGATLPSESIAHAWLVGWSPLNAFTRVFDNLDGHFAYPLPVGLFYAQAVAHPYYIFPLLTPFILIGLWAMRQSPLVARLIVIGWCVAAYVFLMGIPYENFRFGLTLWPPLVVLVGVGFEWVWRWLSQMQAAEQGSRGAREQERKRAISPAPPRLRAPAWMRAALLTVALLSLLGMAYWSARGLQPFFAAKDRDLAVVHWTDNQLADGDTLITIGLTAYFKHYAPRLRVIELYTQTPDTLAPFTCARAPTTLLVDMANIETQWANREPQRNVHWLRDHAGLSEWGRSGAWTLYRVGGACH